MKSNIHANFITINNKLNELLTLQYEAGVAVHQLARNPFPMKKLILATFVLHNQATVKFPNVGLLVDEIISNIKAMKYRVTKEQVLSELQNLKKDGKIDGSYFKGSARSYVWFPI